MNETSNDLLTAGDKASEAEPVPVYDSVTDVMNSTKDDSPLKETKAAKMDRPVRANVIEDYVDLSSMSLEMTELLDRDLTAIGDAAMRHADRITIKKHKVLGKGEFGTVSLGMRRDVEYFEVKHVRE